MRHARIRGQRVNDRAQPTFLIEIEGHRLSRDITHEITSFVFEDNEEGLDVMEVVVTARKFIHTSASRPHIRAKELRGINDERSASLSDILE